MFGNREDAWKYFAELSCPDEMEAYMDDEVKCKDCLFLRAGNICMHALHQGKVAPEIMRECAEFQPERTKCGDCIHFSNRDCPVGNGNTTADHICECVFFSHFANGSKMVSDNVNHPSHYNQGGIECVDAMKACVSGLNEMEAVCTSHALKYLWRWKHKNGAEDIRKCIWWLERLLKEIDNE